jgi:hypothetical protein
MSQKTRVWVVVGALVLVALALAIYGFATQKQTAQAPLASVATPQPGMIHLYVDGAFVANVSPTDMQKLPAASFTDKEQGKPQGGWWLRDVIRLYVKENKLSPNSQITIAGSRKGTEKKSATVAWAETLDPANNLELSFSNDGQSVKLASTMDNLSTRDQWVQGVTQIDIQTKP